MLVITAFAWREAVNFTLVLPSGDTGGKNKGPSFCKHHQHGPVMAECKQTFPASWKSEAIRRFRVWCQRWQVEAERAVCCLEKDFYHLQHYFAFPPELWKKIRTTNVLERAIRGYGRRTRPMQGFPSPESAERIYYGVTDYLNRNWEERPQ
jgi:transposase-like protein